LFNLPLRLRTYAVVAVGFERLVWEKITAVTGERTSLPVKP
jgi:hypothetical protein